MVNVTCVDGKCGVDFAIPEHIQRQGLTRTDRLIYCPNGHSFHYTVTEEEKLKKKIEQLEASIQSYRESSVARDDRIASLHRSVAYWKGIAHRKRGRS